MSSQQAFMLQDNILQARYYQLQAVNFVAIFTEQQTRRYLSH